MTTLPPTGPSALDAQIGPLYDTAGVAVLLGGARVGESRRRDQTLLAVQTADGRWVYPVFQFTGRDVDPALTPAIQATRSAPPWAAALWFVTPNPDLTVVTPLEWARTGRPTAALVASAQRTAREWH